MAINEIASCCFTVVNFNRAQILSSLILYYYANEKGMGLISREFLWGYSPIQFYYAIDAGKHLFRAPATKVFSNLF